MTNDDEMSKFNDAMAKVLKADPARVKAAMEQEKREREEERKAKRKGEQK